MISDINKIDLLVRREIEAKIVGPLITAMIEKFDRDKVLDVVRNVITSLAKESGKLLAQKAGGNSSTDFAKIAAEVNRGVEREVIELTDRRYRYNIVRCKYAELYKELGLSNLGYVLSCDRDFHFVEGFNPKMKLVRTKTIMEGDSLCDFDITIE